jgi:hypothetical protein
MPQSFWAPLLRKTSLWCSQSPQISTPSVVTSTAATTGLTPRLQALRLRR